MASVGRIGRNWLTAVQGASRGPVGVAAAGSLPVLVAIARWRGITGNSLRYDDYLHHYEAVAFPLWRFLLEPFAGHMYSLRNAIWLALRGAFGLAPAPAFGFVLALHIAVTLVLFRILYLGTASRSISSLGATAWTLSPVHEESIGWLSVLGHPLATLLTLTCFVQLLSAEASRSHRRALLLAAMAVVAASQCFGVGIAMALVFPLLVSLLVPRARRDLWARCVVLLVPCVVLLAYVAVNLAFPQTMSALRSSQPGAAGRSIGDAVIAGFSLISVLWKLLCVGASSVLLGPIVPLVAPLSVATSLAGGVVLATALAGVWTLESPSQRLVGAALIGAVAAYSTIAAGRAPVVAAVGQAVEITATMQRFHYLGSALLTVAWCVPMAGGINRLARVWRVAWLLPSALLAGGLWLHWQWAPPLAHSEPARRHIDSALASIGRMASQTPVGGVVCIHNHSFSPAEFTAAMPGRRFPGWAGYFLILGLGHELSGRRVYFTTDDPAELRSARESKPLGEILIPRSQCPPARAGG